MHQSNSISVIISYTIGDPCLSKKGMRQCRLNGKDSLKLNEDLGAKMRPLDSRTVFIDAKVRLGVIAKGMGFVV